MPTTITSRARVKRLQDRLDAFGKEHRDLAEAYELLGLRVREQDSQEEATSPRPVVYQSTGTDPRDVLR